MADPILNFDAADAVSPKRRAQIARKQAAGEAVGMGARIPAIDDYVREQMTWGLSQKPREPRRDPELWARTEAAFRTLIGAG